LLALITAFSLITAEPAEARHRAARAFSIVSAEQFGIQGVSIPPTFTCKWLSEPVHDYRCTGRNFKQRLAERDGSPGLLVANADVRVDQVVQLRSPREFDCHLTGDPTKPSGYECGSQGKAFKLSDFVYMTETGNVRKPYIFVQPCAKSGCPLSNR